MAKSSPSGKAPRTVKRSAQSAEIAFQKLRKAILSGEFKEGDRVREIRLVRDWKIGRTPLREAIRRAAESGYLVLRPNHAPVVRKLTADDIRQIYALREILECFALECAWDKLREADVKNLRRLADTARKTKDLDRRRSAQFIFDSALHQLWTARSGNPWLITILERLFIFRPNYQTRDTNMLDERSDAVEQAFAEHESILVAIEKKNLKAARRVLRRHISHAGELLAALHESGRPS